uniref:Reverse transcriptase domain-containing protein n=1 Tax=Cannabis sativa TaxID=3483 RepID=A0A803PQ54_CANSA
MEGIAENMASVLSLTEKEAVVHEHLDDVGEGVELGKSFCLVFRVFTTRNVKLEWFEEAMRNAWITRAPISFSEYGNGMFMVEFGCEGDMRRVIEGQPWHFDHCLVTSANPAGLDTLLPNQIQYSPFWIQVHSIPFGMKSYKLAKMIGDEVGDFLEADKMTLLKVSGLFLRIRVLLDVSKPIPRGILVDFRNIHKEKWLNFKYESLPNICFHCGMFDHTLTKCVSYLKKCDEFTLPPPLHYKIPLKAPAKTNFKRNPFDLSNSYPLDELPFSQGQVDQTLAAAVNQFLTTQDVEAGSSSSGAVPRRDDAVSHGLVDNNPISSPEFLTSERTNHVPVFPPGFNCTAPVDAFCDATQAASPTLATAVHTTVEPGSDSVQNMARITEKSKGKAIAGAKRSAFTPHSVMVDDSLRNILKRARAGPVINEPSTADDPHSTCDTFRTRLSFDSAFEVPRNGLSGGLLLFWNNDVIVNILNYSSNHIDYIVTFEDNVTTHVTCYYGSPYVCDKIHTWVLLDRLFDNAPQLPWLVFLGDFNDYLSAADRSSRSSLPHYAMVNFQAFVNKYSLVPIHFVGNKFTWKHGSTFERLDWGIANEKWFPHYPQALLHHLSFYGSDHRGLKLVLFDNSMCRVRNKRFLFENHWLTEPSFFTTVNNSWSSSNSGSNSNPLSSFLNKQSTCIVDIQTWNKSFNSLSFRIKDIDRQLNSISSLLPASSEQLSEVSNLQSQLDSLLYKQEIFWKQRSKVHWLRAGDKNTKFFHHKASSRKKTNFIRNLTLDDGSVISNNAAIEAEICRFFSTLFHSQGSSRDVVNLILSAVTSRLTAQQFASLDSPFTSEEVRTALFQLSGDKAPGSDGLNAYFYQKNWSTLGGDLCTALLDILNNNASMASINKTLIVLIPKKSNASSLKDFRPISLCSTLYKIVSKTIANRIKPIIENIISPTQSAFLADRLIFDNILIAQEMVHAINHRKFGKVGWVGLKLDMEKAFDRVEWDFLLAILHHVNFPNKLVSLIHQCLSSVSTKFSVNGNITKEIFPSRGLRQGDPLSPYLFLLCSEGLAAALRIQEQLGNFDGISIARSAPAISHLLFADDTLVFAKATHSSCNALQAALQLYNQATGQCVNFGKSSILFSPNTPSQVSDHFYHALGLSNRPFLSKYLGVPQCFGRVSFFINANGTWDVNQLSNYFDHDTVATILQVPIGGHDKADCLIWKGGSSGLLTVKSAYHLANTSTLPPSSSNTSFYNRWWKFFWNQTIPPKVKNFGWRTFHHILPTAFNLYRKKVVPSPSCSFCGCALETVTHALLDCSRVRQVWKLSSLYHFYLLHINTDIKDFMLSTYTELKADDFSLLMCTLWSIWEFRNKKLFRNANPDAGNLVQWTTAYLSQYREAQVKNIRVDSTSQVRASVLAPQAREGSYQLYTDAAIQDRNGKIGLGAVVKDWKGQVVAGVSMPLSAKIAAVMVEAMALRLGLNWCCNVRLPLSIILTDCQQLVNKVYSHKRERSALADVILDIKNSLSHLPNAKVYHTPRDSNIHAHHMAKGALGLDEELVWKDICPNLLFVT